MKRNQMDNRFKRVVTSLFALMILGLSISFGQPVSRIIERSYEVDPGTEISFKHQRGTMYVKQSTDSKCHAKLEIQINGSNEGEIDRLFEAIDLDASEGKSRIRTKTDIVSWQHIVGLSRVKLKGGDVLRSIKSLNLILTIWVPAQQSVKLSNRYEKIVMESLDANPSIALYSGDLEAQDINGDLSLAMKYSRGNVGRFRNGTFDFYETDLDLGNGDNLEISSKYSTIKIGTAKSLSLDSYEDDYQFSDIDGAVSIEDKYSEFNMKDIGEATFNLYETYINFQVAGNLMLKSKYSDLTGNRIAELSVSSGYEDKVKVDHAKSVLIDEDKYSEYRIGTLSKRFKIKGYQTFVDVDRVESSLEEISIESRYDKMNFGLPASLKYNLDAQLKYGTIKYREESREKLKHKKVGSETVVQITESGPAPKISIRTYETDIVLQ